MLCSDLCLFVFHAMCLPFRNGRNGSELAWTSMIMVSLPSRMHLFSFSCLFACMRNRIIEYRANTFGGVLKGNLFMGKVAFGANGLTFRAELSDDGTSLKAAPYAFHEESGLSMTMGLYGEIVMPQLKKYRVIALRPHETGATSVEVIYVHPPQGPASGGNQLLVTGHFLNQPDVVVMVGGNACTNIKDMTYQHLKCTAPPGSGKVSVVVSSRGKASPSRGHEYEYL